MNEILAPLALLRKRGMGMGQEEAGMTNTLSNHYHHYYDQVG